MNSTSKATRNVQVVCALQNKAASPVAPAVPAQIADEVIRVGQDEFHDALEAALESASSASVASASGSQPDLGEASYAESELYHMFFWMYA